MFCRIVALLCGVIVAGCAEPDRFSHEANGCANREVIDIATPPQTVTDIETREPNGLLTLRDALSLTLLHNPELKAWSYEIRAAEARIVQAGLWQNPELEIEVENIGGSGPFRQFDAAETTIQLSQIIEPGGKIGRRRQVAACDSRLAEIDYQAKRLAVSGDLTRAFITLLFIQEKQALSQQMLDISEAIAASVEKRVQAGKVSSVDGAKAAVSLARSRLQQLQMIKYRDAARIQLAAYWAAQKPAFTRAAGRLDELSDLPDFEALQGYLNQNPQMLRRAVELEKRKAEMALADAQVSGDVRIGGGVRHFNDLDDTALVFGLSIPLAVSDRNQGTRAAAVQQYRQSQQFQQVTEMSLWSEIHRLYADLQAAHTAATILRDELMAASESIFHAVKLSYEQGKADYLELLNAQQGYFDAQNDYIDALADYHLTKTELEQLMGQSLQDTNPMEK